MSTKLFKPKKTRFAVRKEANSETWLVRFTFSTAEMIFRDLLPSHTAA